jgi:putative ABC transport system permease protein
MGRLAWSQVRFRPARTLAAWFASQLPARLLVIAAAAVAAGILVTVTAALLPTALLRRLPAAHLLAEE